MQTANQPIKQTIVFSILAMLAFAGNSVLCRMALVGQQIDPLSFTLLRLTSGALTLWCLVHLSSTRSKELTNQSSFRLNKSTILAAVMLFAYALFFSLAYISLDTATGALVLFGVVQVTLIAVSLQRGQRLSLFEWFGLLLACAGLVYLLFPELNTPSFMGLVLMSVAGFAWAVYTLGGQGSKQPLTDTMQNFIVSAPLAILAFITALFFGLSPALSLNGVMLAVASGAITSGLGYAIWYAALPNLSTTVAAVMQLSVPVIAAVFGMLLIYERPTMHLMISAMIILSGILIVILQRANKASS